MWIPFTLDKRNHIMAAVNSRYHKQTHKFGFEVPKAMEDTLHIYKENGDTRRDDAMNQEMGKVRVAFKIQANRERKLLLALKNRLPPHL